MGSARHTNHRFTLNERLAILEEYEVTEIGQRGAVLRRHDISSGTISRWGQDKRSGLLEPSDSKETLTRLTRKERADYLQLKKENAALKDRLARAESTVEVLGKASALLEALAKSATLAEPEEDAQPPAWGERYLRRSTS